MTNERLITIRIFRLAGDVVRFNESYIAQSEELIKTDGLPIADMIALSEAANAMRHLLEPIRAMVNRHTLPPLETMEVKGNG